MSNLVERLSNGRHAVSVESYKNLSELKDSIDRNFVLVNFTETKGGTQLGFALDQERASVDNADFQAATGTLHLEGDLTLDFKPVRVVVDIDLNTLTGEGHLELMQKSEELASSDKTTTDETIH